MGHERWKIRNDLTRTTDSLWTTKAQLERFWRVGYMIYDDVIPRGLAEEVLASVSGIPCAPIFKRVYGKQNMDDHRFESIFPEGCPAFDRLRLLLTQFVEQFRRMHWEVRTCMLLESAPGGVEQQAHVDFSTFETEDAKDKHRTVQAGLLAALMPNTKLVIYEKCFGNVVQGRRKEVTVPTGSVLVFRGDLAHAGAKYADTNFRVHAELTVRGIKSDDNSTQAAVTPMGKCKHCPQVSPIISGSRTTCGAVLQIGQKEVLQPREGAEPKGQEMSALSQGVRHHEQLLPPPVRAQRPRRSGKARFDRLQVGTCSSQLFILS